MTALAFKGSEVLANVAAGRSPWSGWEAGHAAKTPEGRDAYQVRADLIAFCRQKGLLTAENLLTEAGEATLRALEDVRG